MRILLLVLAIGSVVTFIAACGGDDNGGEEATPTFDASESRVLHMTGYDVQELQFARNLFLNLQANPRVAVPFCIGIEGGSPQDVLGLLDEVIGDTPPERFLPFQAPRPGQTRTEDDALRAAEIMISVCDVLQSSLTPQAPTTPTP